MAPTAQDQSPWDFCGVAAGSLGFQSWRNTPVSPDAADWRSRVPVRIDVPGVDSQDRAAGDAWRPRRVRSASKSAQGEHLTEGWHRRCRHRDARSVRRQDDCTARQQRAGQGNRRRWPPTPLPAPPVRTVARPWGETSSQSRSPTAPSAPRISASVQSPRTTSRLSHGGGEDVGVLGERDRGPQCGVVVAGQWESRRGHRPARGRQPGQRHQQRGLPGPTGAR